ncbi:MAG: hypothetical protein WC584_01625 [Candidatus Pacearchaeota archaeon]
MKKIRKTRNFLPHSNMGIKDSHPTENRKNKKVFHLSKTRDFEDRKFSVPFKTKYFEGYKTGSFESQENLKMKKQEVFTSLKTGNF